MTSTQHGIDCLNSLLRGELSATETYQQAVSKLEGSAQAADLKRIHVEHREAANLLRQQIHESGGKPDQGSGAWGAWAKTVEVSATLFGDKAALKALKEGEEQGAKDYQRVEQDTELSPDCRALIHTQLLPRTREHISTLDRLMSVA